MDEWSEWKEVSDWSLVSDVGDEFAYDRALNQFRVKTCSHIPIQTAKK